MMMTTKMINLMTLTTLATLTMLLSASAVYAQPSLAVSYETADGATISADLYGSGAHAVVLAHGMVFDKSSWKDLAGELAEVGFQVLAIDFRGYGKSKGGSREDFHEDILGAIRYLRAQGAERVSIVGGSMGGGAAGRAATQVQPGEISKLILLSPAPVAHPDRLSADAILFVASRGEGMVRAMTSQFERAPEPKRLELLDGDAHAQHIFKTSQADALSELILEFLGEE